MRSRQLMVTTAIVASMASFGAVRAQSLPAASAGGTSPQPQPASVTTPDSSQVAEVVVTSRKIAERLQDVPVAISAFTSRDLARQGVREPSDLSNLVPGLNYEKDFGRRMERPVIRGQSNVLGVPNVSFFIDGVFVPDSLFNTDLAFVDRVEVIKGPQSALYGRQSFAGAISYINKVPASEWQRTARITGGSYDYFDLIGTASGPLIKDKLGIQLAANYYTYGGQYRNNAPGDSSDRAKVGSEETKAASLGLRYTGIDHLDAVFRLSHSENNDGPEVVGMQRGAADNCFFNVRTRYYCGEIHVTPADIHANNGLVAGGGIGRRVTRSSLNLKYDLQGYTLASITGFNRSYESRKSDLDYLPVTVSKLHVDDTWGIQSVSQEFRIESPTSGRFSWLAGAYYYNASQHYMRFFFNDNTQQDNGVTKTVNYAAFGLARFKFTDQLSASAEVRVGQDFLRLVGGGSNYNLKATYTSTNPRFTLDYKVNPNALIYVSAAKGNKPGGFNTDIRLQPQERTFGEETSWEYELGAKTELFGRRLRLNGSLYYIDWTGQQLTQSTVLAGPVLSTLSFIRNVGNLDVKGAELEAVGVVTSHLSVRMSASLADSTYKVGYDPDSFTIKGNGSIIGNTSPNAPRNQYSAGVTAWRTILGKRVTVDADFSYRSKKYDQVINLAYVPGRAVTNVRLFADVDDDSTVTFAVTNLFDNIDPVSVTRYSDFATVGPLRSFLGAIPPGRRFTLSYERKF